MHRIIVLLLTILGGLTYFSVVTQQNEAQNFYKINQDLNGLKFNSSASPAVLIRSQQDGDNSIVSVSDNGIGIAEEYKEKIFQIFKRLNSKDKYKGSGIGLSICRRIINHHGGEIWVESELGKGSSFHFTIPK